MDVSSIKPQVNSTVVRDGGVSSTAESRQKQGFSNLTAVSPADDQSVGDCDSIARGLDWCLCRYIDLAGVGLAAPSESSLLVVAGIDFWGIDWLR